ncbi:M15 family metallopeptidase [Maribacter sp. MAR_2009_72]|uniref:M15 family metallopeptidase n=1 Tax=Maribacter sp. MAR_2009_72 TaxID=1250050 RepID=UPI0011994D1F|nr:M15 family metallopeptidase [Maribacter sp. MAR_2009_72]TVZ15218.1 D-alanyl-D-alanine carboxypeptidase-like protein [Maribacter sp. MAR_2009_72]
MKRRNFIQKSSSAALAISLLPTVFIKQDDYEYSILELMGKADIELFGKGINLRKEAHDAFLEMKMAAYNAGIDLKVVSSYRDFSRQEAIFERKYITYTDQGMAPLDAIDKIIEYSTIPGTSRHHWGTDIDIVDGYRKVEGDVLVPSKFEAGGPYEDFKLWMDEHSETYGFYLVYTNDPKRRGFKYEPWHYSYAPLSIPMLEQFRGKNIAALLTKENFYGAEHFTKGFLRSYIQNNILDINEDLL